MDDESAACSDSARSDPIVPVFDKTNSSPVPLCEGKGIDGACALRVVNATTDDDIIADADLRCLVSGKGTLITNSCGFGSHVVRRACFGFPMDGDHVLNGQIGRCAVGRGAVVGVVINAAYGVYNTDSGQVTGKVVGLFGLFFSKRESGASAGTIIDTADYMDAGVTADNVDTRSSNFLGTYPTSSWPDRFVCGFRPLISSVLDIGGDEYPPDRSGSMIGASGKVNSVAADPFIAVTYSSFVCGSEQNRSGMVPIVEQSTLVGSIHLTKVSGIAGPMIAGDLFIGSRADELRSGRLGVVVRPALSILVLVCPTGGCLIAGG